VSVETFGEAVGVNHHAIAWLHWDFYRRFIVNRVIEQTEDCAARFEQPRRLFLAERSSPVVAGAGEFQAAVLVIQSRSTMAK